MCSVCANVMPLCFSARPQWVCVHVGAVQARLVVLPAHQAASLQMASSPSSGRWPRTRTSQVRLIHLGYSWVWRGKGWQRDIIISLMPYKAYGRHQQREIRHPCIGSQVVSELCSCCWQWGIGIFGSYSRAVSLCCCCVQVLCCVLTALVVMRWRQT